MTLNLATFFLIPNLRAPYKKTTSTFGPILVGLLSKFKSLNVHNIGF